MGKTVSRNKRVTCLENKIQGKFHEWNIIFWNATLDGRGQKEFFYCNVSKTKTAEERILNRFAKRSVERKGCY
jgi:hypothetical protein